MKLASDYAKATYEAWLLDKDQEVFKNLDEVLKRNRHLKLKRYILNELLRLAQQKQKAETVSVTVARESDFDKFKSDIEKYLKELEIDESPKVKVDETLVGGFKLEAENKEVDKSYKQTLLNLYHQITNHN